MPVSLMNANQHGPHESQTHFAICAHVFFAGTIGTAVFPGISFFTSSCQPFPPALTACLSSLGAGASESPPAAAKSSLVDEAAGAAVSVAAAAGVASASAPHPPSSSAFASPATEVAFSTWLAQPSEVVSVVVLPLEMAPPHEDVAPSAEPVLGPA